MDIKIFSLIFINFHYYSFHDYSFIVLKNQSVYLKKIHRFLFEIVKCKSLLSQSELKTL